MHVACALPRDNASGTSPKKEQKKKNAHKFINMKKQND